MYTAVDMLVFLGYFVAVVAIGFACGRGQQVSVDGYFRGNNRLPWYAIGLPIVAAGISSEQFVGEMGYAHKLGMPVVNWEWLVFPALSILLWVFVPLYVRDIGDGSQDALLVRVAAGGLVGWGECEAAPLVSIAAWNCPMSHSACKPVSASVLGQPIDSPDDIRRINALVRANSLDLLQADHTLSGVDVALWDLLGKRLGQPVYRLLGYERAYPKLAYASVLFGDAPQATYDKAQASRRDGYRAVKFGWGPFGHGSTTPAWDICRSMRDGSAASPQPIRQRTTRGPEASSL